MKNVILPINQDIEAKPLTAESIGLIGTTEPVVMQIDFSHITISESLRNRIDNIRFASEEKANTENSNKPK